jgi:hypothetical protein
VRSWRIPGIRPNTEYRNKLNSRMSNGLLLQDRFKPILVETESHLRSCAAYIVLIRYALKAVAGHKLEVE